MCCSEHLCSLFCLLDCKSRRWDVRFHFSAATNNKSNPVADSNWQRVKATLVKKCFVSLLLPHNAASRTWQIQHWHEWGRQKRVFHVVFPYTFSTAASAQMPFLSSFVPAYSSSSVDAMTFSPLQPQHPKPCNLWLVITMYTRACVIINKLGRQVRTHRCHSTGYYQAINSLAQKTLYTLNRCTGSFFQGLFPVLISRLLSGWAHGKCRSHFNL